MEDAASGSKRAGPFSMVEYLKEQIKQLSDKNTQVTQVKKLSQHDYIVQGKRF